MSEPLRPSSPEPPPRFAPGPAWFLILGAVGFCAGFFGPLTFVPEANQGPLVGILLTGPGGFLLGVICLVVAKIAKISARTQWLTLCGISVAGTIVILLCVQPGPKLRGYLVEIDVTDRRVPGQTGDEIVANWKQRFKTVTWAVPRAGWEAEMRKTLDDDRGTVIDGMLVRERRILEHRKPWNRGRLSATAWQTMSEPRSVYARREAVPDAPVGKRVMLYLPADPGGRVTAPDAWPPHELEAVIGLSITAPLPAEYARFAAD